MEECRAFLTERLKKYEIEVKEELRFDTAKIEDLGIDSLTLARLLVDVEEHYGIQLSLENLNFGNLVYLSDIENMVCTELQKA